MTHLYPIFVRTGSSLRRFKAGFVDAQGTTILSPTFDDAGDFRDGQAPVQMNHRWGLIDTEGSLLFPCNWLFPTRFVNDFAVIREKLGSGPERRGFMRRDGSWLVEPKYVLASDFSCGLASVFDGHLYGFINERGEEAIPLVFQDVRSFSEGVAPVKLDDKWGYIDPTGKSVIHPQFQAAMPFQEGIARVCSNGRWGFIDHAGEFVISAKFGMVWDMHAGLAVAYTDKQSPKGFVDKTGEFVIEPVFEYVGNFQEGLARVTPLNQKFTSFIKTNGNRAFAGEFWSAESFYKERALVKTEMTMAYVDTKGNMVWEAPIVDRTALPI